MKEFENIINVCTEDILTTKSQIFKQAIQSIPSNQLMIDPFDQYLDGLEDMLKTHTPHVV